MSNTAKIPAVLSIGGSDPSAAAGVQADLKTFSSIGVYGATVITALTVQNTRGVYNIHIPPAAIIAEQIEAILSDLNIKAIKIGMLGNQATIEAVASTVRNFSGPIILDPVMVSSSGDKLLQSDAEQALRALIETNITLLTPNLDEAACLLGTELSRADFEKQTYLLRDLGPSAILLKGGHAEGDLAIDYLLEKGGKLTKFEAPRINTPNNRGTGCTLSSAIAANLTKGLALKDAVSQAKQYLTNALKASHSLNIGEGAGPVHHFHKIS